MANHYDSDYTVEEYTDLINSAKKYAEEGLKQEEIQLDLFYQPQLEVHCYLPSLDGYTEVGNGCDEQAAKEDYLMKLEYFIKVLQQNVKDIMYGDKELEYFGIGGGYNE